MTRPRTQIMVSYAVMIALLGMFAINYLNDMIYPALSALFGLFLVNIPALMRRRGIVALPWELVLWIFIVVFLHNLGLFTKFYDTVWWWDKLTHLLSTSLIAAFGFIGIVIVDKYTDTIHLPPRLLPFLIVIFVLAMGVFWELVEFFFDTFFGTMMQYSLQDTVMDLVFNLIGALIVAIIGPWYLRRRSVDDLIQGLEVEDTIMRIRSRILRDREGF